MGRIRRLLQCCSRGSEEKKGAPPQKEIALKVGSAGEGGDGRVVGRRSVAWLCRRISGWNGHFPWVHPSNSYPPHVPGTSLPRVPLLVVAPCRLGPARPQHAAASQEARPSTPRSMRARAVAVAPWPQASTQSGACLPWVRPPPPSPCSRWTARLSCGTHQQLPLEPPAAPASPISLTVGLRAT